MNEAVETGKRHLPRVVLWIVLCAVLSSVAVGMFDAWLAIDRMNPVPAARAAAVEAGWKPDALQLASSRSTGGPFGSAAVVVYTLHGVDDAKHLEVRLRRPFLRRRWETVRVVAR